MTETTQCSVDKLNLLRQLADREHHLLNDRTNIFFLWQSILMASFALGNNPPQLGVILMIFDFVSSVIWLYIGHRCLIVGGYYWKQICACEEFLPSEERVYTNAQNWRSKERRPILRFPVSMYFAYLLPGLWAIIWAVLFFLRILKLILPN